MRGPSAHFWFSVCPLRPLMSILATDPVMASKPVASTSASTSYSLPPVRTALAVISSIGLDLMSTSVTFERLNAAK